ncbi:MAG: hypothetical protein V7708_02840 [Oceanicoccus sp.]
MPTTLRLVDSQLAADIEVIREANLAKKKPNSKGHEIQQQKVRAELAPRREPYWREIESGMHVGFYKSESDPVGSWRGRYRKTKARKKVKSEKTKTLYVSLPSTSELSYSQAVGQVKEWVARLRSGGDQTEILSGKRQEELTVWENCMAYRESRKAHKTANAFNDLEKRFNTLLLKGRDPIAKMRMVDVTREDLTALRDRFYSNKASDCPNTTMREAARKPATVNRYMTVLRAAFRFYFPTALTKALTEGFAALPEDTVHTHVSEKRLTDADKEQLIAHAGYLTDFIRTLFLTGARPIELRRLRVCDVRPNAIYLSHRKGDMKKTGLKTREFPLNNPELREIINRNCEGKKPEEPIFTTSTGLAWCESGTYFSAKFAVVAKRAGLPNVKAYDARHTVISKLVDGEILPLVQIANLMGTSLEYISNNYYSPTDDKLTAGLSAL